MKISNVILTAAFAAAALFLIAATINERGTSADVVSPSGKTVVDTREAFPLKHIRVDIPIMLILRAGLPELSVEGDEAYVNIIEDVDDDPAVLDLRVVDGAKLPDENGVVVRLSTPELDGIELANSSSVRSEGALTFSDLGLRTAGNSVVELELANANSLSIDGSGTLNGTLRGSVKDLVVNTAGSTEIDALELSSNTAEVELAGSGLVRVNADSTLSLKVAGSGDLEYRGDPELSVEIAGSGQVRKVK